MWHTCSFTSCVVDWIRFRTLLIRSLRFGLLRHGSRCMYRLGFMMLVTRGTQPRKAAPDLYQCLLPRSIAHRSAAKTC